MNSRPVPDSSSRWRPPAAPASRLRAADPVRGSARAHWKLTDFVDVETLQKLQDGFAELCGAAASIRDAEGQRITQASCPNRFCNLVGGNAEAQERCQRSNAESAARAASSGQPAKYVCHAGLTQYAASIELEGQILGTIVLGDRPDRPLARKNVLALARETGLAEDELWATAQEIVPWSDREMRAAISFLQLLANTLTAMCYQTAVLRERLGELLVIEETSRMLSSDIDLDTVLNNTVRTMAELMNVKACSLRLLDDDGKELVIKAAYNLSRDYLKKGPVLVAENAHDQTILAGGIVRIRDMAADPSVRYPEEARREGLVSSLGVGLISGGKTIGTLHVYTSAPHEFTEEEARLFRSVASQAATAIEKSQLLQEQVAKLQMEHELKLAADVQRRMLPTKPPIIPGIDIHASATFSAQVGGDFYDFLVMPEGRTGIAIADTVGKSIPAAILMASVRSALKAQAQNIFKIGDVMSNVNRMLCEDSLPSEFVTLVYAVLDSKTKRMAYSNAGHDPPMLLRHGEIRKLDTGGPLLGVMPEATFEQESLQLEPGDTLLFYTDGAIDAMDYRGQRWGRERFTESFIRHAAEPYTAEELATQILWDIRRFAGFRIRTDDLTLMVIRVNSI
jgi:sigma-B regulation protein RsbU (phosphoserine phosphatase)